jgi:hypothetical protein
MTPTIKSAPMAKLFKILSRADLLAHLAAMGFICAATTMSMVNLPFMSA